LIQKTDDNADGKKVSKLDDEEMKIWEDVLTELIRVLDWTSDDA